MPWIKFVHIVALVCWCGALLYLPMLLVQSARLSFGSSLFTANAPRMPRFVYNSLVTPAALFAIASGTLLFLVHGLASGWLVLKLMAVVGMVLAHGASGWLVLRLEHGDSQGVVLGAMAIWGLAATCMLAVVGIVLVKPSL